MYIFNLNVYIFVNRLDYGKHHSQRLTHDRPDLSSERMPQKDKTVTLREKIYGQMSQIWARHQDILTDWPSVAMLLLLRLWLDCRAVEVPSDEWIKDVPWGVHNHAQDLRLESFQNLNVGGGSSAPELYAIGPDEVEYGFIE
jgi:hypothetical protein